MAKTLTIIIPVYNVEKYIRPCLLSVLSQGLITEDYEVILINDGTPDNSFGMITDLIKNHNNIKVIEQNNKGLSAARNIGLEKATGRYIIFIDSDDYLIENSLRILLNIAIESNADLIVADYVVQTDETTPDLNVCPTEPRSQHIKSGPELLIDDLKLREYFIWRTIYKRDFLIKHHISFIEGITFEDSPFTIECYLKAEKCARISYPFYVYRRRHGSLSSHITLKSVKDLNIVIESLWLLAHTKEISPVVREHLFEHIYVIFSLNMWYISKHKDILIYRGVLINDLKKRVPKLCFHHGIKQRMVSFCFKMMPCFYLKIRSLI